MEFVVKGARPKGKPKLERINAYLRVVDEQDRVNRKRRIVDLKKYVRCIRRYAENETQANLRQCRTNARKIGVIEEKEFN